MEIIQAEGDSFEWRESPSEWGRGPLLTQQSLERGGQDTWNVVRTTWHGEAGF